MSLSEFHEWVREIVRSACEEALQDENFVPDPIDDREGVSTGMQCVCQNGMPMLAIKNNSTLMLVSCV